MTKEKKEKLYLNKDLINYFNAFGKTIELSGAKYFAFHEFLAINRKSLRQAVGPFNIKQELYEKERKVLNEKYCLRDEAGKPIFETTIYGTEEYKVDPQKKAERQKEYSHLMLQFNSSIEEWAKKESNWNPVMFKRGENEVNPEINNSALEFIMDFFE